MVYYKSWRSKKKEPAVWTINHIDVNVTLIAGLKGSHSEQTLMCTPLLIATCIRSELKARVNRQHYNKQENRAERRLQPRSRSLSDSGGQLCVTLAITPLLSFIVNDMHDIHHTRSARSTSAIQQMTLYAHRNSWSLRKKPPPFCALVKTPLQAFKLHKALKDVDFWMSVSLYYLGETKQSSSHIFW